MTSFVHVAQPTEHPGVIRAGRAADTLQRAADDIFGPRGAASLLLAAIVAALLVVANQVIDTWTEGHLLFAWSAMWLAWIAMWTIAFAALALAARPMRGAVDRLGIQLRHWAAARRAAEQDEKLWQTALSDPRVMADISRAMSSHAGVGVRRYY